MANREHEINVTLTDLLEETTKDRGRVYGDFRLSFQMGARALTSLVETHYGFKLPHDLPPHIHGLMMAMNKALRCANDGEYNEDSYHDGMNYFRLAMLCDPRRPENEMLAPEVESQVQNTFAEDLLNSLAQAAEVLLEESDEHSEEATNLRKMINVVLHPTDLCYGLEVDDDE